MFFHSFIAEIRPHLSRAASTGTITDLATIPRLLWSIFPPHGRYAKAAIVHDSLYDQAIGDKAWADAVFLEAMTVLGVPRPTRTLLYWGARLFGRGNYPS
jgi:hypothetical protein